MIGSRKEIKIVIYICTSVYLEWRQGGSVRRRDKRGREVHDMEEPQ